VFQWREVEIILGFASLRIDFSLRPTLPASDMKSEQGAKRWGLGMEFYRGEDDVGLRARARTIEKPYFAKAS